MDFFVSRRIFACSASKTRGSHALREFAPLARVVDDFPKVICFRETRLCLPQTGHHNVCGWFDSIACLSNVIGIAPQSNNDLSLRVSPPQRLTK